GAARFGWSRRRKQQILIGTRGCDPQFHWVIKLKDVACDIDDLLHEVQLESEKHKMHSDGDKHAIFDRLREKPKSFAFRRKMASKIKDIKDPTDADMASLKRKSNIKRLKAMSSCYLPVASPFCFLHLATNLRPAAVRTQRCPD
ncbi:hypothetical protein E2562_023081, partial [Oryza meyeriana var. granulata]